MRIRVGYETTYTYDRPLRSAIQLIRMTPRRHDGQRTAHVAEHLRQHRTPPATVRRGVERGHRGSPDPSGQTSPTSCSLAVMISRSKGFMT